MRLHRLACGRMGTPTAAKQRQDWAYVMPTAAKFFYLALLKLIIIKMPVDDLTVIDFVSLDLNGNTILTISDHLEWDENNEHLFILQSKINVYLDAIENGSLYEAYPDAKNRNIIIQVAAKYEPNEIAEVFLERTEETLKTGGYDFSFSVFQQ